MSKRCDISMSIWIEDSETINKEELIKWIESQYYHSVTEGYSMDEIIFHNSALKMIINHIKES